MSIILETVDLTKHFGSLTAVKQLSLQVSQGEILGFLGPNGAGKTTSISMICGLLKPNAGSILFQGSPVNKDRQYLHAIGFCPQNIILWEKLTCIEQLQFIGEMYGMKSSTARRAGDNLLEALDLVEKRSAQACTLSGGMRRRLTLALSLVHDPEIVILDEPEAGLDPQSRVRTREFIRSLAPQKTVILTTHNMDEADRLADRIAIIDHGELLVLDTPEALKKSIGAADVLEISLLEPLESPELELLQQKIQSNKGLYCLISGDTISLRSSSILNKMPEILELLSSLSINFTELRLRENTLEDVFLYLTGRRLRE